MTKKIVASIGILAFGFLLGIAGILLEYHQIRNSQLLFSIFFAFLFFFAMFFILRRNWIAPKKEYKEAEEKLNTCAMYRNVKIIYAIIVSCILFISFLLLVKDHQKMKLVEISSLFALLAVTGWYSYTIRQCSEGEIMKDELKKIVDEALKRGIRTGIIVFSLLGIIIVSIYFLSRYF